MSRNRFFILLAVLLSAVSCSASRRVSQQTSPLSWRGRSALEIIDRMGDPARIEEDGRNGSILIYESTPDYDDPRYDILDPDSGSASRRYARFYLDQEGECYQVDANHDLPAPSRSKVRDSGNWSWLDLILLLLVIQIID